VPADPPSPSSLAALPKFADPLPVVIAVPKPESPSLKAPESPKGSFTLHEAVAKPGAAFGWKTGCLAVKYTTHAMSEPGMFATINVMINKPQRRGKAPVKAPVKAQVSAPVKAPVKRQIVASFAAGPAGFMFNTRLVHVGA